MCNCGSKHLSQIKKKRYQVVNLHINSNIRSRTPTATLPPPSFPADQTRPLTPNLRSHKITVRPDRGVTCFPRVDFRLSAAAFPLFAGPRSGPRGEEDSFSRPRRRFRDGVASNRGDSRQMAILSTVFFASNQNAPPADEPSRGCARALATRTCDSERCCRCCEGAIRGLVLGRLE